MKQKGTPFFDEYADRYSCIEVQDYDYYFLEKMQEKGNGQASLLDIGGGDGTFARLVKQKSPSTDVTVIDPSKRLLDKIDTASITKVLGALPSDLNVNETYDFVHVKEVLHHLTGRSIADSKKISERSLFAIRRLLKEDGLLLIHELFYEGYLIPSISRFMIFAALRIQNTTRVRIPQRFFLLDLDVCFYTRREFRQMLSQAGYEIVDYRETPWTKLASTNLVLLKTWGRMLFVCRKKAQCSCSP